MRRIAKNSPAQVKKALPHRGEAARLWGFGLMAWCGSTQPPAPPIGTRIRRAIRRRSPQTFREACDVAEALRREARRRGGNLLGRDALLEADGRSCWRWSIARQTIGFQADMAHTLLYHDGIQRRQDAILPPNFDWKDLEAVRGSVEEADTRPCGRGRSTSTSRRTTLR